jgi:dihydrofolate reductase
MRRSIISTYITLDGVIQRLPEWHFDYVEDEAVTTITTDLFAAKAVLMGRATYEGFAGSWPKREGDYTDRINALPKYVAGTTLEKAEWNNTTILRDAAADVTDSGHHSIVRRLSHACDSSRPAVDQQRLDTAHAAADVLGTAPCRDPSVHEWSAPR